jgi:hypothetical protein
MNECNNKGLPMSESTVVLPIHLILNFQYDFKILDQSMKLAAPSVENGFRPSPVHEAYTAVALNIETYLEDMIAFQRATRFFIYNPRTGRSSDPVDPQQLDVLLELLKLSKQEPIIRKKLEDLLKLHTLIFR